MADRIVTLEDKNGDTLYPVAGSMAAGSINTNMLKDDSVTSDKIDWETIGSQSTTLSSLQTTSSATLTPMLTLTISETGKYLVQGGGGAFSTDAPGFTIALGANSTFDDNTRQLIIGLADFSGRHSVAISKAYSLNAGDTISLFLAANSDGKTATLRPGFTLSAIRIG